MAEGPKLPFQKYKAVNKPTRRTSPHHGALTAEPGLAGRSEVSTSSRPLS
jgi:hypothetical protein